MVGEVYFHSNVFPPIRVVSIKPELKRQLRPVRANEAQRRGARKDDFGPEMAEMRMGAVLLVQVITRASRQGG